MSQTDDLLAHNRRYAQTYQGDVLPTAPKRRTAVVACMDSRLDLFQILGLRDGEVHLIRNAGAIATDDVLRSLTISQRKLNTEEIILIAHDRCGQVTYRSEELAAQIEAETGASLPFDLLAFDDVDQSVRASVQRIRESSFLPAADKVRGFVFEHKTGLLREVR